MNIAEKPNSSFHLYYFFLIISLYFSLGFILSFFYPLANDAGKYFSVMKEVANGSVIHNDIIPGTINYSFYTITSFFLKLYNWNYETFRCLLVFLNGLGIILLYISLNKVFTKFVSSLWISFYALNPFIISRILEINHYSISNIFLLFGMSFILTSTRFKSNLLFFLSIFSFTVCGVLRPHLAFLPVATILFYVVICKNKLQTLFLSSLILIFLIFMNSSFYSNSETTNQSRQNEILYLSEIIDKIPIDKKKNIILNIAKDAQIDLVNINTLSFVGDDPSYESDKYISMNECDSKIENPYIKQNENNIHKNEIISKHWCYYDHKGNYHQSLIENNNFTDSGLEKLIKRLKIGCGNGWFLDMVKNDVASIECIELSPSQALKLKGPQIENLSITENLLEIFRIEKILNHIISILNIQNFFSVLGTIFKGFLLFDISFIMIMYSALVLVYFYKRIKSKEIFVKNTFLIEFFFLFIGCATFLRYLTSQDFSYWFHFILFFCILSSISIGELFQNRFKTQKSRIFIIFFFLLTIFNFTFHTPKVEAFNPLRYSYDTYNDKKFANYSTIYTPQNLRRIGKVLDELLEKNDRFFTDFSGLSHFSNRKSIVGTEMNQHKYFMQSLFFYLKPILQMEPINVEATGMLGIEYLIHENKIKAIVNFGEIDSSLFRRNKNLYYLYKKFGKTEIWLHKNN